MYCRYSTPRIAASPRVLVVEDHADGREALRLLLSVQGCDVEVARDGMEAVRLALQSPPDAAVIDVVLPRLDGGKVARRLRAALGESVVLVAYSAYDSDELGWRLEDTDFDFWLIKPADPAKLRRCLGKRPPHRDGEGQPHIRFAYSPAT